MNKTTIILKNFLSDLFTSKRLKGFLWLVLNGAIVGGVNMAQANITNLELTPLSLAIVTFALNQVTKSANTVLSKETI